MSENPMEQEPRQERYFGFGAPGERLPFLVSKLSVQIEEVWETIGGKATNSLFDAGVYRRVAKALPRISMGIQNAALKLASSPDPQGKEQGTTILFHSSLPTIFRVIDRFAKFGLNQDDLLERGILATLDTIQKFKPGKVPFIQAVHRSVTFASQEALAEHLQVLTSWVRRGLIRQIPDWINEFHAQNGRLPKAKEIAVRFHLRQDVVFQLREGILATRKVQERPANILGEEEAFKPAELAFFRNALKEALAVLPPRERKVLGMRFGLEPWERRYSLKVIASELKCTPEWIRQIVMKALRKLRKPAPALLLDDFLE